MKSKTKEVFYCEFCNKNGLSRYKMEYHEKVCTRNPENYRPCLQCKYISKKEAKSYNYFQFGIIEREVELLFCDKKDVYLYTPKNQIKGNQFDLGDFENNPMPKECELFTEMFTEMI